MHLIRRLPALLAAIVLAWAPAAPLVFSTAAHAQAPDEVEAPEHLQSSQREDDRFIDLTGRSPPRLAAPGDPRHHRGSLAPPPAAPPLGETASASALHAHLAQLLDIKRAPSPETAARAMVGRELADRAEVVHSARMAQNARHVQLAQIAPVGVESAEPDGSADQRLSPHEDPERQPDGVPHLVIGLTALLSVAFAIAMITVLLSGPSIGSVAVAVLTILGFPVLVVRLNAKADRDRDRDHPSR